MTTNTKGGVMKLKGSRRLVARLGLALAVAAVAVPSASAMRMNAMNESGGGYSVRHYADDLHATLPPVALDASNVRTDAATPPVVLGSNVQTDNASYKAPLSPSSIQTDAASSVSKPITDARRAVLLRPPHETPLSSSASGSGIDWSVAGLGAIFGALGLMLLVAVVLFGGRHNRRGRLAAT
jgi:hypothetical protein